MPFVKKHEYEKNTDFHGDVKLKNIIKFLILSATLSNTCLFAARLCHIDWGFSDSHGHFGNLNKYDVLCFRFTCEDDYEGKEHYPRAEYECFVRPVNSNGEEIDWSEFASEAETRTTDASKHKEFYKIYNVSELNYDWYSELFTISNDRNGFGFRCGSFSIQLDKLGNLYLGGGGEGDILELCRRKDNAENKELMPHIPIFFDDKNIPIFFEEKKSLVGSTLVIEDANVLGGCNPAHPGTFTNKGTLSFDNIIWRGLTVKNEGKIFARNLILDKSILDNKNEGEIRWSDNYDLYRGSNDKDGNKDEIKQEGKSANPTIKIIAQCEARNKTAKDEPGNKTAKGKASDKTAEGKASDDIGWLSLTDEEGNSIKFPETKTGVTVYVIGEYTGSPCSGISFFETTKNLRCRKVNKDEDEDEKTRHISALIYHNRQVEKGKALHIALVDNEGKLCPPVDFNPDKSSIYIVPNDDTTWGKNHFGK